MNGQLWANNIQKLQPKNKCTHISSLVIGPDIIDPEKTEFAKTKVVQSN